MSGSAVGSGRFKVVVTDSVFPHLEVERRILGEIGADLVALQAHRDDELLEPVADADALLVCFAPVTARVVEAARRCRIIARYGIGVDNVDVRTATARGIVVTNVPDYCVDEVSDHALALVLACARKVVWLDRNVRAGRWDARDAVPVHRLSGQVLGLVGFGKIPRLVARKAQAFGMRVLSFDPYVDPAVMRELGVEPAGLRDLLQRSDYVSVHAPLTPQTEGLIDEAALRWMKPTAYLVNTARGRIVDEGALVRALERGWIAGAALDVLPTEPPPPEDPLLRLDRVILTPHVAFYSEESLQELQRKAAEEVVRVLTGQAPRYPVNRVAGVPA
ncbi:MAG: C-terminal binding protein [Armatimonadota bacterium]|nr:C-terminal binding protein [Armatimonadota bacterium]MDR5675814.1 C-terminal binding protein [Armatimonadota bacterium]MDR5688609.1 C-terminal binding protein [Armatimonadota bacterium]MDR7386565.1 C-terminal binding protein [Armatimonadota bacterium]MDR7389931.1 C-terminal binding protein [Armatimonadota bacterium]